MATTNVLLIFYFLLENEDIRKCANEHLAIYTHKHTHTSSVDVTLFMYLFLWIHLDHDKSCYSYPNTDEQRQPLIPSPTSGPGVCFKGFSNP